MTDSNRRSFLKQTAAASVATAAWAWTGGISAAKANERLVIGVIGGGGRGAGLASSFAAIAVSEGHDSVALVHLANVALRPGRSLKVDTKAEQIFGDEEAHRLLTRTYRQGGHGSVPANG